MLEQEEQRDELLGLKRYLLDFSLLAERDVKETFLWQEYMVYAALLGVAKQVMEQLRRLYPGQLDQVEQYQRYLQSTAHWNAYLAGAVERQRQESQQQYEHDTYGFFHRTPPGDN